MENKKLIQKLTIISGLMGLVACSPSHFSTNVDCNNNVGGSCISAQGGASYSDSFTVAGGKVDIIIVDDNSASMSFEQRQLAARFGNLISDLDSKRIDYRIGIITTDISASPNNPARAINQNGALQDGHLIPFPSGQSYLSPSQGTAQSRASDFAATIQRPETRTCETFITNWVNSGKAIGSGDYSTQYQANCPSTDERGIYAARLTLENNYGSILRKDADLDIIFLSDEDVRSQLYPPYGDLTLDDKDKASSLVSFIKSNYPQKNVNINSIVTATQTCLSQQNGQIPGVSGSYGLEYNNATKAVGGVLADICTADYSGIMDNIFSHVTQIIVDKVPLACSNPINLQVTNTAGIGGQVLGMAYVFNQKLPVGAQVSYSYTCGAQAR